MEMLGWFKFWNGKQQHMSHAIMILFTFIAFRPLLLFSFFKVRLYIFNGIQNGKIRPNYKGIGVTQLIKGTGANIGFCFCFFYGEDYFITPNTDEPLKLAVAKEPPSSFDSLTRHTLSPFSCCPQNSTLPTTCRCHRSNSLPITAQNAAQINPISHGPKTSQNTPPYRCQNQPKRCCPNPTSHGPKQAKSTSSLPPRTHLISS